MRPPLLAVILVPVSGIRIASYLTGATLASRFHPPHPPTDRWQHPPATSQLPPLPPYTYTYTAPHTKRCQLRSAIHHTTPVNAAEQQPAGYNLRSYGSSPGTGVDRGPVTEAPSRRCRCHGPAHSACRPGLRHANISARHGAAAGSEAAGV